MSHQAVSWALKQPVSHSPAKFILVVLAHHVNASARPWQAYASVTLLAQETGQNRKTVLENLKRLVDFGYLADSGERVGATGRIPVWNLTEAPNGTKTGTIEQSQNRDHSTVPDSGPLNSTETGTITSNSPETGTVTPSEQSQNRDHLDLGETRVMVPKSPTEQEIKEVVGKTSEKSNAVVEKSAKVPSTRGARLPSTWVLPRSWGLEAQRLCPGLTVERIREIADEFRDYWVALPGSKACKLDWEATWRNWVRKEGRNAMPRNGRSSVVGVDAHGVPL
ncbi:helix-turn-helix domain-containing protein [Achromobacter ruhlandii]|uniref:helix-turn-helix domain-containing protein n=1 Tax=Achromobacter ruhlandii TaxID=72557 RepID=UPI0007BF1ED7|nr:helix-turn-helix domain-containing protein [Achromobacter ruhlandii]